MMYSCAVKAVFAVLKSVRLALVLILGIAVLSLLATLVPQGRPDAWYRARYSPALSGLVSLTGMGNFFSSALFLVPVLLFTVNLSACAVDRLVRRARVRAPRRYGPDLIHIGLLVLIAAGLVTGLGRHEKTWALGVGDEAAIDERYTLHLLSFQFLRYDSGAPKEWISTVRVEQEGRPVIDSFPIEVNRPLRLHGLSVFQASWETVGTLDLRAADGGKETATTGEGFQDGGSFWYFSEVAQAGTRWKAVFQEIRDNRLVSSRTLSAGDAIGPFTVEGVSARQVTGLKAVRDPGVAPLLAALAVVLAGLALTFIQKRGDDAQ
jgi:cytochrome c biogenesis protein ResB